MVQNSTANAQSPTRTQRLESLPVTPLHRRILLASGMGWALDAMDVSLISFIMSALIVQWNIDPTMSAWLPSAGFAGMAIGAFLGGSLADRYGRARVFALTLLIYGLATGASALATNMGILIVLRFIVGLGLGAELPVASTLVAEFSPSAIRGRMVVILEAFWALGVILAAVVGTFVVATSDSGWRWGLAVGMIPAIYSMVIRREVPESVAYLESQGRHEEAENIVARFEASARTLPTSASSAQGVAAASETREEHAARQRSIWGPGLRGRTIALWVMWFCMNFAYYGAFIWLPSLLHAQGYSLVHSFSFTLIMALSQIPGYALAAWLIEVWGRRPTLVAFLVGSAISAGLFASASSSVMIIVTGSLMSLFNLGAWGALYAIGPDLYPTALRGVGTGSAAAFGRIAAITAPIAAAFIFTHAGVAVLFVLFAGMFALAAGSAWTLPEQRGVALH